MSESDLRPVSREKKTHPGTPHDIVMRLNREIGRNMQTSDVSSALSVAGAEAVKATPEEFAAQMSRNRERFGAFVREANIHAD